MTQPNSIYVNHIWTKSSNKSLNFRFCCVNTNYESKFINT